MGKKRDIKGQREKDRERQSQNEKFLIRETEYSVVLRIQDP